MTRDESVSSGPAEAGATGAHAGAGSRGWVAGGLPVCGIGLGDQMRARARGARTEKMHFGHRGAKRPVRDLATGRVEITGQNHGFVVVRDNLPAGLRETHVSLFDGSLEGLALDDRPVFSVQYHPEASPGPHDSNYLFKTFTDLMSR